MKKITRTLLILEKDTIALKKMQEMLTASGYKIFAASEILQLSNLTDNNVMELALINVEFFSSTKDAILKGYRPCKVCKPLENPDETPVEIQKLLDELSANPSLKFKDYDLVKRGLEPATVRRFQQA